MSPERRFSEKEISEIFKEAARAQETAQDQMSQSEGLTLAELQEIGKEAGITPEFIASSAASVDHVDLSLAPTRYFGIPISAARTVDLPGPLSDTNWHRLVEDLRETFHATGKLGQSGTVREWHNGNLRAVVEPTDTGHRLRLRTFKGNAKISIWGGLAMLVFGALLLSQVIFSTDPFTVRRLLIVLISALGLGTAGFSAFRLPFWAKERERQMELIANRAIERARNSPSVALPISAQEGRIDLESFDESADSVPLGSRNQVRE